MSLPIAGLDAFRTDLEKLFEARYPGWEICLYGHVGDGNLHINVMKPEAMEVAEFLEKTRAVDRELCARAEARWQHLGGAQDRPAQKPYLGFTRSEAEFAVMRSREARSIRNHILNPGRSSTVKRALLLLALALACACQNDLDLNLPIKPAPPSRHDAAR